MLTARAGELPGSHYQELPVLRLDPSAPMTPTGSSTASEHAARKAADQVLTHAAGNPWH